MHGQSTIFCYEVHSKMDVENLGEQIYEIRDSRITEIIPKTVVYI